MANLTSIALASAFFTFFATDRLSTGLLPDTIRSRSYQILEESRLYLEGSSNVNQFKCRCEESFPAATFSFESDESNLGKVKFADTRLAIKTRNLECGNRMMNKDLQRALNAEVFPQIAIQLSEAIFKSTYTFPDKVHANWTPMTAQTFISIAGQTRKVALDVQVQKTGHDRYRFTASKDLLMSDFGITPPTALLGLVKVDDRIRINLDLVVLVQN